jgi:hypothetical protein
LLFIQHSRAVRRPRLLAKVGIGQSRPFLRFIFYTVVLAVFFIGLSYTYTEVFYFTDDLLFKFRWESGITGGLRGWITREFPAILGWLSHNLISVIVFTSIVTTFILIGIGSFLYILLYLIAILLRGIYLFCVWLTREE